MTEYKKIALEVIVDIDTDVEQFKKDLRHSYENYDLNPSPSSSTIEFDSTKFDPYYEDQTHEVSAKARCFAIDALLQRLECNKPDRQGSLGQTDYMVQLRNYLDLVFEQLYSLLHVTERPEVPKDETYFSMVKFMTNVFGCEKESFKPEILATLQELDHGATVQLHDVTKPGELIRVRKAAIIGVERVPRLQQLDIAFDVQRFVRDEYPKIVKLQAMADFADDLYIYLSQRGWDQAQSLAAVEKTMGIFSASQEKPRDFSGNDINNAATQSVGLKRPSYSNVDFSNNTGKTTTEVEDIE